MSRALRSLVWAACLPLLWPPGVCPHHGPVALLTGDPEPADDPCCEECSGADQSRLVEPAVALALDLLPPPEPIPVTARLTVARRPAPPPDPSPPPPRASSRLNC